MPAICHPLIPSTPKNPQNPPSFAIDRLLVKIGAQFGVLSGGEAGENLKLDVGYQRASSRVTGSQKTLVDSGSVSLGGNVWWAER